MSNIINNTLYIKAKLGRRGEEIRRVQIPSPGNFATFKTNLMAALELKEAPFVVRYTDDEGDEITLLNDADLVEALRQLQPGDLLRVSVQQVRTAEEGSPHRHHGGRWHGRHHEARAAAAAAAGCPAFAGAAPSSCSGAAPMLGDFARTLSGAIPQLLAHPGLRNMAEQFISNCPGLVSVETGHICDVCNTSIVGERYHSTTTDNWDACAACRNGPQGAELEAKHKFVKVSAFDALMRMAQSGGLVDAIFCHKPTAAAPADDAATAKAEAAKAAAAKAAAAKKEAEAAAAQAEQLAREAQQAADEARARAAQASSRLQPAKVTSVAVPEASKEAPKVAEREKSPFETNLATLEAMGFNDRKRNIQVLVRNRNKLFESIQELLNAQ